MRLPSRDDDSRFIWRQARPQTGDFKGPRTASTSDSRAAMVGSYPANSWGLHDMHGNSYEWCRDWFHSTLPGGENPDLSLVRGTPNRDGTFSRVRRGGCWADDGWACRSAFRLRFPPEQRYDHIGFRVVAAQP
jgi:formylglycine-generating enzyme required for sulfatase activity